MYKWKSAFISKLSKSDSNVCYTMLQYVEMHSVTKMSTLHPPPLPTHTHTPLLVNQPFKLTKNFLNPQTSLHLSLPLMVFQYITSI